MLRRLGLLLLFSASIPALTVGLADGQTALCTPPANDPPAAAPDATANPPPRVFDLDATTSTATREERPLVDVPASVTVIDQREIDRRAPHTIRRVRVRAPRRAGPSPDGQRGSLDLRGRAARG